MSQHMAVQLKPVVHFREFPFGTADDPSMREFLAPGPWEHQDTILAYLRSGHIVAYPMGADLPDYFDRSSRANPMINGRAEGGTTPMTDGVWLWPAGLIYFIERYNVRIPQEFVEHAARLNWAINLDQVRQCIYEFEY